jgi:hypothetical protein
LLPKHGVPKVPGDGRDVNQVAYDRVVFVWPGRVA